MLKWRSYLNFKIDYSKSGRKANLAGPVAELNACISVYTTDWCSNAGKNLCFEW